MKLAPHTISKFEALIGSECGVGKRFVNLQPIENILTNDHGLTNAISAFGFSLSPSRAVAFSKTSEQNWALPWHQDRVILMPDKTNDPAYKNWTQKSGFWHCEPPASVLANMAFLFITFNTVSESSGGLELCEGTHRLGVIKAEDVNNVVAENTNIKPNMQRGEVLLIKALTLHRSALNQTEKMRRSLRIDLSPITESSREI